MEPVCVHSFTVTLCALALVKYFPTCSSAQTRLEVQVTCSHEGRDKIMMVTSIWF